MSNKLDEILKLWFKPDYVTFISNKYADNQQVYEVPYSIFKQAIQDWAIDIVGDILEYTTPTPNLPPEEQRINDLLEEIHSELRKQIRGE